VAINSIARRVCLGLFLLLAGVFAHGKAAACNAEILFVQSSPSTANPGDWVAIDVFLFNSAMCDEASGTLVATVSGGGSLMFPTVAYSGIPAGQSSLRSFALQVDGSTSQVSVTVNNQGAPGSQAQTATVNVNAPAAIDLSVSSVSGSPASVNPGGSVTYTVDVTNNGATSSSGGTVTASITSGTLSSTSQSFGSLAAGATTQLTFVGTSDGTTNDMTFTASVAGNESDDNAANDSAGVTTTVNAVSDLSVVSITPSPGSSIVNGESVTFDVTVRNDGPSTDSATLNGSLDFGSLNVSSHSLAGMASGETRSVQFVATPDAAGNDMTFTASVSGANTDDNASNNQQSSVVTVAPSSDLVMGSISGPGSLARGDVGTYSITVNNSGLNSSGGISWMFQATNGVVESVNSLTCGTMGTTAVSCNGSSLSNGASQTVDIQVRAVSDNDLTIQATATPSVHEANATNNTQSTVVTVSANADVSVDNISASQPSAYLGETVTFQIDVSNAGPSTAENVDVALSISGGAIVSATAPDMSCTTSSCTIASLTVGAARTITVTATASATGSMDLTASISSLVGDTNTANDSGQQSVTIEQMAGVSVTGVSASSATIWRDESVTYTVTVENLGPNDATGIEVGASAANATLDTNVQSIPALANGQSTTVQFVATSNSSSDINATFTLQSVNEPNTPSPASQSITTTVGEAADYSIVSVTPGETSASVNSTQTVIVRVRNAGPNDVPATVSLSASHGSIQGSSSQAVTLAAGLEQDVSFTFQAPAQAQSVTLTANVEVDIAVTETSPENNSSQATVVVDAFADLSVSLTAASSTTDQDQPVQVTADVTNAGPSDSGVINLTLGAVNGQINNVSGATCSTQTSCQISSLSAGQSASVTFDVTADAVGTVDVSVDVAPTTTESASSDNSATTSFTADAVIDLEVIAVVLDQATIRFGETATATVQVRNNGPSAATGVVVVASSSQSAVFTPVEQTISAIAAGQSVSIDFSVEPLVTGTHSITGQITGVNETNRSSATSGSVVLDVSRQADLRITNVTADQTSVNGGDLVTFTVAIENAGPDSAQVNLAATATGGVLSATGTTFTLAAGGFDSHTFTAMANESGGTLRFSVTASSTRYDPVTSDNAGSTDVTVSPRVIEEGSFGIIMGLGEGFRAREFINRRTGGGQ
jgi:uncharacterized repeat protein (TIGR01451 family)